MTLRIAQKIGKPTGMTWRCIGCGAIPLSGTQASVIASPYGVPQAVACAACCQRATADPKYRQALEICAASGVPYRQIERVFAGIGVFEVPATPEGIDDAIGLPAGSVAAAAAALRGGR